MGMSLTPSKVHGCASLYSQRHMGGNRTGFERLCTPGALDSTGLAAQHTGPKAGKAG
eukprot:CAMPEP_0175790524 /NCGR_PEP_ID=MMETSP0097-20121207/81962_1 /TAXON_ID=311494 /ORGANISM="Alexandrium monilatum, Strain CCMP3105" /LENGTH=56 /DNA_ID=CAMNT_0017101617 /DNA_START=36 /DNA_END=203 /DNA_ORIENTATION=-